MNALANETSPYLLQHKDNPVDWLPWGPEALDRARREDRPLLVSIRYSSCHWCHVMERESFEDGVCGVETYVNDRERRTASTSSRSCTRPHWSELTPCPPDTSDVWSDGLALDGPRGFRGRPRCGSSWLLHRQVKEVEESA